MLKLLKRNAQEEVVLEVLEVQVGKEEKEAKVIKVLKETVALEVVVEELEVKIEKLLAEVILVNLEENVQITNQQKEEEEINFLIL